MKNTKSIVDMLIKQRRKKIIWDINKENPHIFLKLALSIFIAGFVVIICLSYKEFDVNFWLIAIILSVNMFVNSMYKFVEK